MTQTALAFDLDRCLGCHSCTVACMQEYNLPSGSYRQQRVLRMGPTKRSSSSDRPYLEMYYVPLSCQHCQNPSCVEACPNGAISRREDGVVLIDKSECNDCRLCVEACPYNLYVFNDEEFIEKCTLCVHLLDKGNNPACVKACMCKCIYVGDIDDPDSEISSKIKEAGRNIYTFTDSGNNPTTRYILNPNTAVWCEIPQ